MKVKLSYTVEEEEVLSEAGKLLSLCQPDFKQGIDLFQALPEELSKDIESEDPPNIEKVFSMLAELREALFKLDSRAAEVDSIVRGFSLHRLESSANSEQSMEAEDE